MKNRSDIATYLAFQLGFDKLQAQTITVTESDPDHHRIVRLHISINTPKRVIKYDIARSELEFRLAKDSYAFNELLKSAANKLRDALEAEGVK